MLEMPHKRKNRNLLNQKNPIPRRVITASTTPAPNVCVRADNGDEPRSRSGQISPRKVKFGLPDENLCAPEQSGGNNLLKPQFNTAVRRQSELQALLEMRAVICNDFADMTPRSKAFVAPKVTQKMNFPPDRIVFNDLCPLNVNDSAVEQQLRPPSKSSAPKASSSKASVKEPQLSDYVEPIELIELTIPEPELNLEFPQEEFNFLEAYKKVYN